MTAIPPPATYTIEYGDTLSQLAKEHGTTVAELASINDIDDIHTIYAGDSLTLSTAQSLTHRTQVPTQVPASEAQLPSVEPQSSTFEAPLPVGSYQPVQDPISNQRIETLHPEIQASAASFVNAVEAELGITLRVTDGLRTFAEQDDLYYNGGEQGEKVTNAKGGQSYHNYGLAIDVVEITDSGGANYGVDYAAIATIAKDYGFEWGGSFGDSPHFQYTAGFSHQELLARSDNGRNPYVDLS